MDNNLVENQDSVNAPEQTMDELHVPEKKEGFGVNGAELCEMDKELDEQMDGEDDEYTQEELQDQKELVSIVIPVYNAAKHLKGCLISLRRQTYRNIEIILVDDGSKDESLEICREFAEKDSRIRVYTQENRGPSAARNLGVSLANGDYLVFSDSDDWMDKHAVRRMHRALTKYQTDLVIGGYARFRDGNKYDDSRHRLTTYSMVIMQTNKELASLFFKPESNLAGVSIWGKMYKMSIIRENDIRFPEDINYEEDCCFNLQYFRHVGTTAILRDIVYHYRQAAASLSKTYNPKGFGFLVNGFNKRCEFIEEIGLKNRLFKVKSVFSLVIIATYKKIAFADLTKEQRIAEYQRVMDFQEVKTVVEKVGLPKRRLSRMLIQATREGNAKKVYCVLEAWKMVSRVKKMRIAKLAGKVLRKLKLKK